MAAEVRKRAGIRVETDGGERMGAVSHAPGIQKLSEELDSVPGARLSVRCETSKLAFLKRPSPRQAARSCDTFGLLERALQNRCRSSQRAGVPGRGAPVAHGWGL